MVKALNAIDDQRVLSMREQIGDIWTFHSEKRCVIITTNIGWRRDGANPMGAGTAKQAADLFPELPAWYGQRCQKYKHGTAVCYYQPGNLILFPTKPLNISAPWLSWQADASIKLITRSAQQLAKLVDILEERKKIAGFIGLPLVGCQNGHLRRRDVIPILRAFLDDRFVLLERDHE